MEVHFASSPHSIVLCRKKTIAMHMGMKAWTNIPEETTCRECRRLLGLEILLAFDDEEEPIVTFWREEDHPLPE